MPPKRHAAAAADLEPQVDGNGLVVLHRSSFIEWQPSPVVALASSADGSLAAAAREDGSLELYETATSRCFQRIPGHKDAATTCLALVNEDGGSSCRLFTAGLDGMISEVDVERREAVSAMDSYGGAVWQLAVEPAPAASADAAHPAAQRGPPADRPEHSDSDGSGSDSDGGASDSDEVAPPRLAAACDDGCVRLFSVDPGVPGASYAKSLPRVEGRVLAVAWHPTQDYLVSAGTDGCIHAWHVGTGREIVRITAGDGTGREACIWSLLVLPDGTIVSGDSTGNVTFWDGQFGTLLARFTQHKADVLQLAASPDGSTVFAAGVDPQVAVFQYVAQAGAAGQPGWVFLSAKRPHTHDVRAMCVCAGKQGSGHAVLWTGGNDTSLLVHSVERFLKEHPSKVEAFPQKPLLQAASSGASPRLLCAQGSQLDLWELPAPSTAAAAAPNTAEGQRLHAPAPPQHLARITNRSGRFVAAATLSADGSTVAYSDVHSIRSVSLLNGGADSSGLGVARVQLPADLPPAVYLAFQPGSGNKNTLVAISADATVHLITLPPAGAAQEGAGGDAEQQSDEGPSSGSASGVHTIREIHDLRYKMWYKRDRGRSAARRLMPALDQVALSPDGQWLAAVVRGRVHLLSLETHRIVAQLPPPADHSPLVALCFTGDSAAVVTAAASNRIASFEVPGGQPTSWSQGHSEALPQRLADFPGPISGISASVASPGSVLLHSPEAVCHLDFSQPLEFDPGTSGGGVKRRRRRDRTVRGSTPVGLNCRVLYCTDPVLHVQYLGGGQVLAVERAWAEVWKKLPPPMYRHRYGT